MAGSASVAGLFVQRVVVGVGDMAVSNSQHVVVSTYALGSCVGLVAYDPRGKLGGILHLMLPESSISPEKAARQPAMFADTGLPAFFRALASLKASGSSLRFMVAGGARVLSGVDPFQIGERNARATMDFLTRQACVIRHSALGGEVNRTMHLELATGIVTLKLPLVTTQHSLVT